jgi:tetratricopeptide (TPR) repeat protein
MIRVSAIFFLLIISLVVKGQTIEETFQFAHAELKKKNYSVAERSFERVIYFDDSRKYTYESYLGLGEALFEQKNYRGSAEAYRKAADHAQSETSVWAIFLSAKANTFAGSYNVAISQLNSIQPASDTIERAKNFYLGISYFLWDDLSASKEYFLNAARSQTDKEQISKVIEELIKSKRNPRVFALMSLIVPGSGQLINGDVKNAVNSILLTASLAGLFYFTATAYTILDAYITVFPWFQRYYLGGASKSYKSTVTRNKRIKDKAYLELLNIFEIQQSRKP